MIVVSYDIADDKLRSRFSKMLTRNGAVRLQYSVYELVNTKRVVDNLMLKIDAFSKHFTGSVSVLVFVVSKENL